MKPSIVKLISDCIGCDQRTIITMGQKAPFLYRKYRIPKKTGGFRKIYHPAKETKALQYALIEIVFKKMRVHQCAAAYIEGRKSPLLGNARLHAPFKYSIRIDFKDFFPSIKPRDLFNCFSQPILLEDKNFMRDALFIEEHGQRTLVIGAPASPIISNIVMYSIDEEVNKMSKDISLESIYTRYADDLFFSTNLKGACLKFLKGVEKIIADKGSPNLVINTTKTTFLSRRCRRTVTGLVICPDAKVSLGRRNKEYIKKLIYRYKNNQLNGEEKEYLKGYLAFVSDVEPTFLNRLAIKYKADTVSTLLRRPK